MAGTTVYILLGSNIGDREKNLATARERLEYIPGFELGASSSIYISDAVGMPGENPAVLNQVIKGEYTYRPSELLVELERIETALGRTGKGQKQPRTIDLDILLFGDDIIETESLSIPHRELLNRPFAMVPLLQIDPDIIHPVTKEPVASFLTDIDRTQVLLYRDHVARQR